MNGKLRLWLTLILLFLQVSCSSSWWACCQKSKGSMTLSDSIPHESPKKSKYKEPIELKHRMIKNPDDLPIESSFQKHRWFQYWALQSIVINTQQQRLPKPIVQIILSYLVFVPRTHPRLCKHAGGLYSAVLSRNGHWLVTSARKSVHLTEVATGARVRTLRAPTFRIYSIAIADSCLFVAGGSDHDIYLWNTSMDDDLANILMGHVSSVTRLCFFFNDTRLISGSCDGTLRIWAVTDTPAKCLLVLKGHKPHYSMAQCVVSTDHARIISVSFDDTLRIWDSLTGECLRIHPTVWGQTHIISEDQQYVGSTIPYAETKIWNIDTGEIVQIIPNVVYRRIFYLSAERFVLGSWAKVCVWDLRANEHMYTLSFEVDIDVYVQHFSNGTVDRKYLVVINREVVYPWVKVYSFETGVLIE